MSTTDTTRVLRTSTRESLLADPRIGIWPLPRLDGISPCILQSAGEGPALAPLALGYPGRAFSSSRVPVFATQDGTVAYARTAGDRSTLCVDHPGGWSTHYAELEDLLTRSTARCHRRRERIRAGDVIGHVPRSSLRICFGWSRLTGHGRIQLNPGGFMVMWSMLPWFDEPTPRVTTRAAG